MGNCLARHAFKADDKEEEPRYERTTPKTCENIQSVTSGNDIQAIIIFEETLLSSYSYDDIFEPLSGDIRRKKRNVPPPESKKVNFSEDQEASAQVEDATKEGISKVMSELERELGRRNSWLNKPEVSEIAEEIEAFKSEQNQPLKEDYKKSSNRRFRKKRQASPKNIASSEEEVQETVEVDSANIGWNLPQQQEANNKAVEHKTRTTKLSPSFQLVKPHYRFKNIANKRKRNRAAKVKKQSRCVPIKAKAD